MSSDENLLPSSESEDVDQLLSKAKQLVNEQFRPLIDVSNTNYKNWSKKQESAKNERILIRKEWEKLKNASRLSDDLDGQILMGTVVYLEVDNLNKKNKLEAMLKSMGATVCDKFGNEVTHIVFKNGSLDVFKRAKLLNVNLVSALWVEACRNSNTKVYEKLFPVFVQNEYSHSPRLFRKFLEYRSKHFEYDENSKSIVRKTQLTLKDDQEINLEQNTEPSSESVNLQMSSDESEKNSPNKQKSPTKRKLFTKRPLDVEFITSLNLTEENPSKNDFDKKCKRVSNKKNVLVSTFMHFNENVLLKEILTELGGFALRNKVDKFTTHLIAGEPKRTINLLKGIAFGCWILDKTWVSDSKIAGFWLCEEDYELTSFSRVVQRSRYQKQIFGDNFSLDIFDECGEIFISKNSSPNFEDLEELVKLCSGKISEKIEDASIIVGENVENKLCVNKNWIFDSITFGRYKTAIKYKL